MPEPMKAGRKARSAGSLASVRRKWRRRWEKGRAFLGVGARFVPYLRNRWATVALALAFSLGFTVMRLLEPWPLKLIIDNVLLDLPLPGFLPPGLRPPEGSPLLLLYVLVAAIIVIAFVRGLVYYRQRILLSRLGIAITADLRLDLYKHIQYLSLSFHDRRRTGDLIVRLTSDVRMLRQAFVTLPLELIGGVLLILGMAIVMFMIDWQLTILALALLPVLAFIARKYRRPMKRAIRQQREREGHLATLAAEALGAIRVVQGFRRERDEIKRFGGVNRRDQRSGVKAARFEAELKWSSELAVAIVTAVIVLLATRRIIAESLSVGDLIVFIGYVRIYARPLQRLSRIIERMTRATAAGERVLEIFDTETKVKDHPGAVIAPRLRGDITFERVSVAYRKGRPVLHDINLQINAGERVAIVGPTGAGKSTLVSLIPRFYDPTQGRVWIDGRDIREYTLDSLRKRISVVFQEPLLFATTIAENIGYGKPNATTEDILNAARRAKVDHIICRLPDGYDTVIGERGGTLSSGQRQCIAIARAMIRNAPIVILDELTVGLDAESAALVTKALNRLMEGRTVIMISHDFHSIRAVDRVIALERGQVVQEGSYSELMASQGLFRTLGQLHAAR